MRYKEKRSCESYEIGSIVKTVEFVKGPPYSQWICARILDKTGCRGDWVYKYERLDDGYFVASLKEYQSLKYGKKLTRKIQENGGYVIRTIEITGMFPNYSDSEWGVSSYDVYYRIVATDKQDVQEWEGLYGQKDHPVTSEPVQ